MTQSTALPRTLMFYGLSLALAVLMGFLLAEPANYLNFLLSAAILLALFTPLLMRWHQFLLVASLNSVLLLFFLPGKPQLWMIMAGLSLTFAWIRRSLDKESTFLRVPMVSWPLIGLTLVVLVTAKLSGGVGFQVLGSGTHGGKRYLMLLAGVMVYFALTCARIPLERVRFYCHTYFFMGVTAVISNLAYVAGPAFYILFNLFPVDIAMSQAMADFTVGGAMSRITGVSYVGHALFCMLLLQYGVRGLFDLRKPWRIIALVLVAGLSMLGGYRSSMVIFAMVMGIQFFLEGLHRTRMVLIALAILGLVAGITLPNAQKLPLSLQRSLSLVPFVTVSPMAQWDAQNSTQWRIDMWKVLIPQVPKYLIKGKGYAIDPTESYLIQESLKRGLAASYEGALVAGDYHNGPLSVIIPFGLFGLLFFLWFCAAGAWVVYRNYRFGMPELRLVNTFLCSYYLTKILYFLFLYGALNNDMVTLTALVGLSVACNGGVCRRPAPAASPVIVPLASRPKPVAG